jgi:beta-glucosidase
MKCVVLTVSGRRLDITGIVPEAAAVVASWHPGTEGAGVADVLFGDKPFTGRLPETWALAESQLPINVGDASYNPLYPFGWGLRTDNGHARLQSVRDQLAAIHGDGNTSEAVRALDKALRDNLWNPEGTVRNGPDVLSSLQDAANALNKSSQDTAAQDDLVVSVARDIVQAAVAGGDAAAMPATAALTANAEHALLSGRVDQAVSMLREAYGKLKH